MKQSETQFCSVFLAEYWLKSMKITFVGAKILTLLKVQSEGRTAQFKYCI